MASDGTFSVDPAAIKQNVRDLTRDIMTLQAVAGYDDAKQMIATLGVVRPEVQRVLDRLGGVPVDIEPRFVAAAALFALRVPFLVVVIVAALVAAGIRAFV